MRRRLIILITLVCSLSLLIVSEFGYAATSQVKVIQRTKVKADKKVVTAFEELGFKVKFEPKLNYAGVFSVKQHAIILKSKNEKHDDVVLHEMGHFLSRLNDGADETKAFTQIYKAEKKKYNGRLKAYIVKDSSEYFAQSFAEYTLNPSKLKKRRPKTYKFIKQKVDGTNWNQVEQMYDNYSWAWS